MVFLLQLGFGLWEIGNVRVGNADPILFRNLMSTCVVTLVWWSFGYAFAYGDERDGRFIGSSNVGLSDFHNAGDGTLWHSWFFEWAFAAWVCTIAFGGLAERTKLLAYLLMSFITSLIIYPIIVHWCWDQDGWASPFTNSPYFDYDPRSNGYLDFAGSGVVHFTAGIIALIGAIAVGPRKHRFPAIGAQAGIRGSLVDTPFRGHSGVLAGMGMCIIWFCWYGVACGRTIFRGPAFNLASAVVASKIAVNVTLAAATGGLCALFYSMAVQNRYNILTSLNGILVGLVSVSAACAIINPWAAIYVAFLGYLMYLFCSWVVRRCHIDDPLDTFATHAGAGWVGLMAVGFLANDLNITFAYQSNNDAFRRGMQIGTQITTSLAILGWSLLAVPMFFIISKLTGLRASEAVETRGAEGVQPVPQSYAMGTAAGPKP